MSLVCHSFHPTITTMNTLTITFFLSTLALNYAAPLQNKQLRTIELVQNPSNIDLHSSSRISLPELIPSITDLRDEKCMSNLMLKYVNDYRKSQGVSKVLSTCSSNQLNNAVSHSKKMERKGSIYHQKIEEVNLGCSSFFSGENVAKNHCTYDKKNTDPVRLCVDQFIGSESHRKNLLYENHESAAMGVYVAENGYIYCTQTFSQSTKYSSSGKCAPLDSKHAPPTSEEKSEPLDPVEPKSRTVPDISAEEESEPVETTADDPCKSFKTKKVRAMNKGDSASTKWYHATQKNGECEYCTTGGECLGRDASKIIDDQISR